MNRGLPRLAGGLVKRERGAWQRSCVFCLEPCYGVVDTISGPRPVCRVHAVQAEKAGYEVRTPEVDR